MITLTDVENLIANVPAGTPGTHTLYLDSSGLHLERRTKSAIRKGIITDLTGTEIKHGLTNRRWNFIDCKLHELQETPAAP